MQRTDDSAPGGSFRGSKRDGKWCCVGGDGVSCFHAFIHGLVVWNAFEASHPEDHLWFIVLADELSGSCVSLNSVY